MHTPVGVISTFESIQEDYDTKEGLQGGWQSMDDSLIQAPVRSLKTAEEGLGGNPTDRGRTGTKIHLYVDQQGIPLGA